MSSWRNILTKLVFLLPLATGKLSKNDFGGDFSATSLSGGTSPGPTAGTMGTKAASAMAIGTGSSGQTNYAENFKTPNYTQYTNQDFKEFLPNYENMMEKSMKGGTSGGQGGSGSGFRNFSGVNEMLKGFMDLQKEQLQLEKAKAEANKAKVDLAIDYDEEYTRRKRSLGVPFKEKLYQYEYKGPNPTTKTRPLDASKAKTKAQQSLLTIISLLLDTQKEHKGANEIADPLEEQDDPDSYYQNLLKKLTHKEPAKAGDMVYPNPVKKKLFSLKNGKSPTTKSDQKAWHQPLPFPVTLFSTSSSPKRSQLSGELKSSLNEKEKILDPSPMTQSGIPIDKRQSWPGMDGKYFRKRQATQQSSNPSAAANINPSSDKGSAPPPFWESIGSKANSWFKNAPPPSSSGQSSGSWGTSSGGSSGSPSPSWGSAAQVSPSSSPTWGPSQSSSPSTSWGSAQSPSPSSSGSPSTGQASWSGSSKDPSTPCSPPPPNQPGIPPSQENNPLPASSNQMMTRSINTPDIFPSVPIQKGSNSYPLAHGTIGISNIPYNQNPSVDSSIIPKVSFALNPFTPPLAGSPMPTSGGSVPTEASSERDDVPKELGMSPQRTFHPIAASPIINEPVVLSLAQPTSFYQQVSPYYEDDQGVLLLPDSSPYAQENGGKALYAAKAMDATTSASLLFYNQPIYKDPHRLLYLKAEDQIGKDVPKRLLRPPTSTSPALLRIGRQLGVENPLVIYKVKKDEFGYPKEVKKVLLDPSQGVLIDENRKGDLSPPSFPGKKKRRRKREVGENEEDPKSTDPNGHSHSGTTDQIMAEDSSLGGISAFPKGKKKRYVPKKKTYQYQSGGGSTDYDYDYVQEEDLGENISKNDPQTREYEATGENGQDGQPQEEKRATRRVRIGFDQLSPGGLPPGTIEKISAGGGKSPGHHEGGGLSVKVKKKPRHVPVIKREKKTLNFFFTW